MVTGASLTSNMARAAVSKEAAQALAQIRRARANKNKKMRECVVKISPLPKARPETGQTFASGS